MGSTTPSASISPSSTSFPVPSPSVPPISSPQGASGQVVFSSTSAPTSHVEPWIVGPSVMTIVADPNNIYNSMIDVGNSIGVRVKPNSVKVQLFDENCENEKNKTGLSIVVVETDGPNLGFGDDFSYQLGVDPTNIGGNPGGLVTFTGVGNEGNSKGRIKFCTRVSSFESSIAVSFRETNFDIGFDLTQNTFSLGDILMQETGPDFISTDVATSFQVAACQCKNDFSCYAPNPDPIISQNQNLVICIRPTGPNASAVHVSNFNLIMSAGSITYSPVGFGPITWNPNAMTDVTVSGDGDIVKISTSVVADFYINDHTSLQVAGNAFLNFDAGKDTDRNPIYSEFSMSVDVENVDGSGCFQTIMKEIKRVFKRTKV